MTTTALRDMLVQLQNNMMSFAMLLTSNREDASDLLQDTTLKVLDNEDKYTENTNFKGWVFTIMRNIFINNYRRAGRARTIIDTTDDLYHLSIPQTSGIASPENTYIMGEVNAMIDSFSDDYRIPFSMHLAGYRYAEIAAHMSLPVGTIKSRIYYARQRLRRSLGEYRYIS